MTDLDQIAVREEFLLHLAAAVRSAANVADIVRATSSTPARSGITFTGSTGSRVSFELAPPISALELARIFGVANAIGESTDVHMSSWRIKSVTGGGEAGPVTAPPPLGRWKLNASLTARPTGGDLPDHRGGPIGRQQLGSADVVRFVSVGPD